MVTLQQCNGSFNNIKITNQGVQVEVYIIKEGKLVQQNKKSEVQFSKMKWKML